MEFKEPSKEVTVEIVDTPIDEIGPDIPLESSNAHPERDIKGMFVNSPGPGRQPLYKPEYCDQVIEAMGKGMGIDGFAGYIGVSRATITNWKKVYPEFKEAYEIGQMKAALFWRKIGIQGITGKMRGFNARAWQFTMMNETGWVEAHKMEHGGGIEQRVILALPKNGREAKNLPMKQEPEDLSTPDELNS